MSFSANVNCLTYFSFLYFFPFFFFFWVFMIPTSSWASLNSRSHAHLQTSGSQECFLLGVGDAGGLLLLLQQFEAGKRKKYFTISVWARVLKGQADKRILFGAGGGGWWIKVLLGALVVAAEWASADHFTPPNLPCMDFTHPNLACMDFTPPDLACMDLSGVWLAGMFWLPPRTGRACRNLDTAQALCLQPVFFPSFTCVPAEPAKGYGGFWK